jgi:hypothetical protein
MATNQFDALAKSMGAQRSRRGAFKVLAGGAAAAALAAFPHQQAEAARCLTAGALCSSTADCCGQLPCARVKLGRNIKICVAV